jgi:hypothetical protein
VQWPPRFSRDWWVVITVFAVTGSTAAFVVRPLLRELGLHGSLLHGPLSYQLSYLPLMTLMYTAVLYVLGRLSGQSKFFAPFVNRTLRLLFFPITFIARRLGGSAKRPPGNPPPHSK